MGESKRRRLGWAIAIATVSATAAWAGEAPPESAAFGPAYRLEPPRLAAAGRPPSAARSLALSEALKPGPSGVDLRLRSRWLTDARAGLADDGFYSLGEQVAYFVAHEPGLVVRLPEAPARAAPPRIELATLELHLPF
ncbi:MAG TPA: hypothetical protein VHL80_11490 [Polyangia bacterium]|nr:hypothetical protein [Polyangia bacterium]